MSEKRHKQYQIHLGFDLNAINGEWKDEYYLPSGTVKVQHDDLEITDTYHFEKGDRIQFIVFELTRFKSYDKDPGIATFTSGDPLSFSMFCQPARSGLQRTPFGEFINFLSNCSLKEQRKRHSPFFGHQESWIARDDRGHDSFEITEHNGWWVSRYELMVAGYFKYVNDPEWWVHPDAGI